MSDIKRLAKPIVNKRKHNNIAGENDNLDSSRTDTSITSDVNDYHSNHIKLEESKTVDEPVKSDVISEPIKTVSEPVSEPKTVSQPKPVSQPKVVSQDKTVEIVPPEKSCCLKYCYPCYYCCCCLTCSFSCCRVFTYLTTRKKLEKVIKNIDVEKVVKDAFEAIPDINVAYEGLNLTVEDGNINVGMKNVVELDVNSKEVNIEIADSIDINTNFKNKEITASVNDVEVGKIDLSTKKPTLPFPSWLNFLKKK
jgi:hypothetical protein